MWRDCLCGWRTYPEPVTNGSAWSAAWKPAGECGGCGVPLEENALLDLSHEPHNAIASAKLKGGVEVSFDLGRAALVAIAVALWVAVFQGFNAF